MKKHIRNDDLKKVKELDLLTYLLNYVPEELVKISRNVYSTKTHGSLKISNGMWTWWAHSIGGKSALDYLIKVEGYEFLEAAIYLNDCIKNKTPNISQSTITRTNDYKFHLPIPNNNNDIVIEYLCNKRCIDKEVVDHCIQHYNLYESKTDHAVIFVGYDNESKARYASKRGTVDNEKRDISGSDKRYGFSLSSIKRSNTLHIFEGAIDLLSYITVLKQQGIDWRYDSYLSLGNASLLGKHRENTTVPVALEQYLSAHEDIKNLYLHLDNDIAGRDTSEKIKIMLGEHFCIIDRTPKNCKDINEFLQKRVHRRNNHMSIKE